MSLVILQTFVKSHSSVSYSPRNKVPACPTSPDKVSPRVLVKPFLHFLQLITSSLWQGGQKLNAMFQVLPCQCLAHPWNISICILNVLTEGQCAKWLHHHLVTCEATFREMMLQLKMLPYRARYLDCFLQHWLWICQYIKHNLAYQQQMGQTINPSHVLNKFHLIKTNQRLGWKALLPIYCNDEPTFAY